MIGSSIEPTSVVSFLLWDVIPNLAFVGSLTIFLTVTLRYRLLAVIAALGLMVVMFLVLTRLPYFVSAALSTYSFSQVFPSDLLPRIFFTDVMLNRLVMLLISVGFLALAAGLHPRKEQTGRRPLLLGTGNFVSCLGSSGNFLDFNLSQTLEARQVEEWTEMHEKYQHFSSTDIQKIEGTVAVQPGRLVALDLMITIESVSDEDTKNLLLSLNPGYQVRQLSLNGSDLDASDYDFSGGLMTIPLGERSTSAERLHIVADGVPIQSFRILGQQIGLVRVGFDGCRELVLLWSGELHFPSQIFRIDARRKLASYLRQCIRPNGLGKPPTGFF